MAIKLLDAATATGAGGVVSRSGAKSAIEAHGTTSSGAGAATVAIEARNEDTGAWLTLATITLTLSTTVSGDGFVLDAPWAQVRANLTAISGTGAAVTVTLGG